MKWKSTAQKNVVILILSLLPFIVGLSYSVYRSSDKAYLSSAINIAGSQRMRTMLISNYAQQLYHSKDPITTLELNNILEAELELYIQYYNALVFGDSDFNISDNNFQNISIHLISIEPLVERYYENAIELLKQHNDFQSLQLMVNSAMPLKDEFHQITELYQLENDRLIRVQRKIDLAMISFALLVTILGLFLTTKIKKQEYHASYDYLTGLRNRYSLFEFFNDSSPKEYTVFFIDLNKFKIINDTYGHEIGDEILIEVAKRLKGVFSLDGLYRFGGDEFIGLIEKKHSTTEDTIKVIDATIIEVKKMMSEPILDSYNRSHVVGLSMGVVSANVGLGDWNVLINLADDLMYDSKSMPGHVIKYHYPSDIEKRINFLNSFNDSFNKDLIHLNYQQMHSVGNESIIIENVTSRWVDQDVEFYAVEFMPVLKRKGYVTELDINALKTYENDMLDKSYIIGKKERKSMFSVTEETLLYAQSNGFFELLKELKVPVGQIIFKVQEDSLLNSKIRESLEVVKGLGYQIAVDNFTCNLGIKNIELCKSVDLIKIDHESLRAFMTHPSTMSILIEFIIFFLNSGKIVILEGLESEKLSDIKPMIKQTLHEKLFYTLQML